MRMQKILLMQIEMNQKVEKVKNQAKNLMLFQTSKLPVVTFQLLLVGNKALTILELGRLSAQFHQWRCAIG